ncbi:MAG: hypothetical protein LBO78_02370 [Rickettsiales bacterium]|jgi:hypothetical protein|nr:hypothetical protein [Rickettsiales bacterium]
MAGGIEKGIKSARGGNKKEVFQAGIKKLGKIMDGISAGLPYFLWYDSLRPMYLKLRMKGVPAKKAEFAIGLGKIWEKSNSPPLGDGNPSRPRKNYYKAADGRYLEELLLRRKGEYLVEKWRRGLLPMMSELDSLMRREKEKEIYPAEFGRAQDRLLKKIGRVTIDLEMDRDRLLAEWIGVEKKHAR